MRHSPTAYKRIQMRPFRFGLKLRATPLGEKINALAENSAKVQSINAFGLKLVQRATFFQDKRIPRSVKLNLRAQPGEWVLYLPNHERTCLFVGDDPTTLARLGAAHMHTLTQEG